MKKLMFAVIACAMGLSGCSSEDDCATNPEPAGDVTEIKLSAGIQGVATRSPVSTNDNITAPFVASATTGDYTTNAWSSTVTFVASPTPTAALSFSPARYYPMDNSPIYIRGYYPAGTLSGKTVTLAGDGTEDVMLTAQASGTKATAGALSFVFNHLLTQLQFKLVAGAGYPASGVNVTSLVIKQQKPPATLDLNTSSLTYTTKDLTLSGTFPILTAGSTINNYPMVKSGEALTVAVTTSDGVTYPESTISVTTEVGKSHLITLTFTPKEITSSISVTAWQTGGTGSSTLQ